MTTRRRFLSAALGVAASGVAASQALLKAEPPAGWVKSSKNPMLSLGGKDDFDSQNIFGPAIAKDGGKYYLFYAGGPAGPLTKEELVRYQIGLAVADDGETWTKRGQPLMPLGERDNFHASPALLRTPEGSLHKQDGLWHMAFCGNRADDVEHATSRDGLTWEKDPRNPVFKKAYSPSLVQAGDELRMYYVHKPGRVDGKAVPWEIRLATGPDIYSLKPRDENPVLRLSQPWENGALIYPYVLKEGRIWVMFYASYWKGRQPQSTAIGMATSPDGVTWTKYDGNPVLTPTAGSKFDSTYTSSQAAIRDGDHYKMYYGGRIDQVHKYFAIGLATHRGPLVPQ